MKPAIQSRERPSVAFAGSGLSPKRSSPARSKEWTSASARSSSRVEK
jgi:hypothetical protein